MTATATAISLDFSDAYFKSSSSYLVSELTAGYVLEWSGVDDINEAAKERVHFFGGSYYLITAVGTSYDVEEMETSFSITVMNGDGQEFTFTIAANAVVDMRVNRSRQPYGKGPGRGRHF